MEPWFSCSPSLLSTFPISPRSSRSSSHTVAFLQHYSPAAFSHTVAFLQHLLSGHSYINCTIHHISHTFRMPDSEYLAIYTADVAYC